MVRFWRHIRIEASYRTKVVLSCWLVEIVCQLLVTEKSLKRLGIPKNVSLSVFAGELAPDPFKKKRESCLDTLKLLGVKSIFWFCLRVNDTKDVTNRCYKASVKVQKRHGETEMVSYG